MDLIMMQVFFSLSMIERKKKKKANKLYIQ
jgi:hypothetical protein